MYIYIRNQPYRTIQYKVKVEGKLSAENLAAKENKEIKAKAGDYCLVVLAFLPFQIALLMLLWYNHYYFVLIQLLYFCDSIQLLLLV